jgi:hypothetical protein
VDETADPGPPHVRPEDMRAGDVDREQVLDRLRIAHAEGRLDLDEFDERITATLAARTYADLRALTADLPGQPPAPPAATPPPEPGPLQDLDALQERDLRCIATASFVYPWWIWVAGPWGLVLLSSWVRDRRQ